jgi:hypothetical protein
MANFRAWAATLGPEDLDNWWELDYEEWYDLYAAAYDLLDRRMPQEWSDEQVRAFLAALARDHEFGNLARALREEYVLEALHFFVRAADRWGEPEAKWQLADQMVQTQDLPADMEALLVRWARDDEDEYVRRRVLLALARWESPAVEDLARASWDRPSPTQEWARITALWCLHRVRSPLYETYLRQALQDPREPLSDTARRMERGEIES